LAVPLTLPELAVIVTMPGFTPVASPLALIIATAVLDDDHVAELEPVSKPGTTD
jgi:hypothetical protein